MRLNTIRPTFIKVAYINICAKNMEILLNGTYFSSNTYITQHMTASKKFAIGPARLTAIMPFF